FPNDYRSASSPVVERLYSLRLGTTNRPNVRPFHLLYGNLERLARTHDYDELLQAFASDIERYIAEAARRKLFVHAGVVGWRGRAILIPNKTFTGKTTLVAEFVRAGATYYSDEFAVLDGQGRVHPFPRPLSLRANGGKP